MKVLTIAFAVMLAPAFSLAQRGGGGHGGGGGGFHGGGGGGFHGGGSMGGGFRGGSGGGFRGGYGGYRGGYGGYRGGYGGYRGGYGGYGRYGYGGYGFGLGFGYGWPYWGWGYGWPYASYGWCDPIVFDCGYGYSGYYGYDGAAAYAPSYSAPTYQTPAYQTPQPPVVINQYPPAAQPQPQNNSSYYRPADYYLIAFNDHTIQAALSFHVEGDTLHYVTMQHEEKTAPLSSVDRRFSEQLNRDRRVNFQLP
jgi:hypothetical protein